MPPLLTQLHDKTAVSDWMNRADVREILNIPSEAPAWQTCADDNTYLYQMSLNASLWIYPILRNKYRILIYSGTTDGAVPTRGTKQWVNKLDWPISRPW